MLTFYLSLIDDHNNDDEFLKIYYKYKQLMYKVAYSHLKDHHYTRDAMQIAFMGIAKNISTVCKLDEEKLEIYILKSIKNATLNILRENNKSYKNVYNYDNLYHEMPSQDNVLENTVNKEAIEEISYFIEALDEKYRDVLTLYFIHQMNFREIATALNKPISTVKDRFKKGHELVLNKFKELKQ